MLDVRIDKAHRETRMSIVPALDDSRRCAYSFPAKIIILCTKAKLRKSTGWPYLPTNAPLV
jgi:hypothetical protein